MKSRFRDRASGITDNVLAGRSTAYQVTTGQYAYDITHIRSEPIGQPIFAEIERCWDELHPGPPYLKGGPLAIFKSVNPWHQVQGSAVHTRRVGSIQYTYSGGFLPSSFGTGSITKPDLQDVGISGIYGPNFGDPSSYGASAYNRFRPKTSGWDAATFLGELRELPKMLADNAKKFDKLFRGSGGKRSDLFMPKALAGNWLEYHFGWVPFVSDLNKMYNTYQNYDRILRRLRRQNDHWTRKGGTILSNYEVTDRVDLFSQDAPSVWPTPPTPLVNFPYPSRPNKWGNTYYETQTETEIWFRGSFKFHIPMFSGLGAARYSKLRAMQQVYGLRISPSVIWNLTPWSWLIDWFTNVGDVIDNVTAITLDRLVSRYAYIMGRSKQKRFNSSTIHFRDGSQNFLWCQQIDVKRRASASPFGFSLSPDDFSAKQWSILAALGLQQGRR